MHNCSVKSHPHDRCLVCVEIPRLEAKVQESEAELAPIKAQLAATKARVKALEARLEARKRPRHEALLRAASRAACAIRTALFKVRLEVNTRFRNMRGAMRLIARSGLVVGGVALRDMGDAMVQAGVPVPGELLDAEPDNIDDDERVDEPIGAAIADARGLIEQANAALADAL